MNREWWSLTLLVAGRERRERMNARSFQISTAILVVAVACLIGIPALIGGGDEVSKVGVVGKDTCALSGTVRQAGAVLDEKVRPVTFADAKAGRAKLRDGDIDALYLGGREVLIEQEPAEGASEDEARLAGAIAQLAQSPRARPASGSARCPCGASRRRRRPSPRGSPAWPSSCSSTCWSSSTGSGSRAGWSRRSRAAWLRCCWPPCVHRSS